MLELLQGSGHSPRAVTSASYRAKEAKEAKVMSLFTLRDISCDLFHDHILHPSTQTAVSKMDALDDKRDWSKVK